MEYYLKLITTHINPDFDAFASAVGIQKLYPDHRIVLEGDFSSSLARFIGSQRLLYPFYRPAELEFKEITSLVVVDASDLGRVSASIRDHLTSNTRIVFFDHHQYSSLPEIGEHTTLTLGACISLVCSLLKGRDITPSPRDATLFATAIYKETGMFSFATTTPEDLRTAAWLLEIGASLPEISAYAGLELDKTQATLFDALLSNVKPEKFDGLEIALASTRVEELPPGLSAVVDRLWNLLGYDNLIALVQVRGRVYFAARSRNRQIKLEKLFETSEVRQHPQVTFGYIEGKSVENVYDEVIDHLKNNITEFLQVRDIMTRPVRTVLAEMPISEASKIMKNTGHSGLPVVSGSKLVGVVTKRDVEKAERHNISSQPISTIMSTGLVTIRSTDSVSDSMVKMMENDVGRLLVLENGILEGIVTRTDLMRSRYGFKLTSPLDERSEDKLTQVKVTKLVEERLGARITTMLRFLGNVGSELSMAVYVVGGFVRDLLLGIPNYDIDVVVEGNANVFARAFQRYFGARVVDHREFMASSMFMSDGTRIDVATARTEYYDEPAMLPNVEMSTIKKDLYRRDFSINAMAIKINQEDFGLLLDFFGCRRDLARGIIRALHSLSFVEDPTRILRAVRFETRFGFEIQKQTLEQLKRYAAEGYIERVTGQRVRDELEKLLKEPNIAGAIERLDQLGILEHVFPGCAFNKESRLMLLNFTQRCSRLDENAERINRLYVVSMVLLKDVDRRSIKDIIVRNGFPRRFTDRLNHAVRILNGIAQKRPTKYSEFYLIAGSLTPEELAFVDSGLDEECSNTFLGYVKALRKLKLEVDGNTLMKEYNVPEGPVIKEILQQLICARLDGLHPEEEHEFVRKLLKNRGDKNEN